jgi:hypothetical protein
VLICGIPAAIGILGFSAIAGSLLAVVWGGLVLVPTLALMLVFRLKHRAGAREVCPACGTTHLMPGPGPWGWFHLRCACGASLDIWAAGAKEGPREARQPWQNRERNHGAQPLAAIALTMAVVAFVAPDASPLARPVTPAPVPPALVPVAPMQVHPVPPAGPPKAQPSHGIPAVQGAPAGQSKNGTQATLDASAAAAGPKSAAPAQRKPQKQVQQSPNPFEIQQ